MNFITTRSRFPQEGVISPKKSLTLPKRRFVKKSSNREENVQYLYFMFLVYYCLLINTPKIYKSVMNSFVLNFRYFEILLKFIEGHAENR